ncbi:putative lysyl-tRNA synthetase (Lysine--tRNA ligase)(LysRS) (GX) [Treponema primitia ZAS-2]|uniref:Putative lysyl-tRNA synthetase (Lysine--tRNA ligase)(LysRS) (GX) n=1 Tax=Treponema primitia (strain ATCC BAA-887 / DSM 12427 / ZAS-2) TaxID=545694 RepID=F5YHD4_TREPZ|nr:amino acid--tRNA ligase-related protein [Treponema primitia]AEF84265.1 putative lysyl-tRNA synthetase (Lysine--tRNA ligase)(LysRS) (GX) [Treponema primitia ZAS-2]
MDIELLWERARIIREVRAFFDKRNYLEADTPLLAPDLIPETCLEVFETAYLAPENSRVRKTKPYWLIPSPEIWMKRLIARHRTSLYQICKCFRNGESTGRLHSPEFTMLEYYTMDAGYEDSLRITEELFARLLGTETAEGQSPLRPPFLHITMEEAFTRWAGFSLFEAAEGGTLGAEARKLGLDPTPDLDTAALYDLIFIHAVEPSLPRDRAVALMDYPAFVPCLAQKRPDGKTVERWELYVQGIELANCYSEETDPEEIRRYFEREGALKAKTALVPHASDRDYWKLFQPREAADPSKGNPSQPGEAEGFSKGKTKGFPPCSGVALGLDRLIMALTGRSTIDSVLPFPMQ